MLTETTAGSTNMFSTEKRNFPFITSTTVDKSQPKLEEPIATLRILG